MRDRDQRRPGLVDILKEVLQDVRFVGWVQIAGGFIGEEQRRPRHQRPANGGALLFALGQMVDVTLELVRDAHDVRQVGGMLAHLRGQIQGAVDAVGMQDVVENRQVVQQRKVLEHKADVGNAKPPPLGIAELIQRRAMHFDLAADGRHNAGQQIDEGRLARPAGSDDGRFRPGVDAELGNVEIKIALRVLKGQPLNGDEGRLRVSHGRRRSSMTSRATIFQVCSMGWMVIMASY